MPAIEYPASLPPPSALPIAARERRAVPSGAGNEAPRARARDAIVDAQAVRWVYSPEEMATWRAWFQDTLLEGQLWFAATLPGRGGWATRVARYIGEELQLAHLGAGIWEVTCRLELRGLSQPPQIPDLLQRSTESASTAETVHPFAMPIGGAAGDVLVAIYSFDKQLTTVVTLDTAASGLNWTDTILEATGARGFGGVAWKIAEGDDVLQFTTNVGEQSQAVVFAIRNSTGDVTVAAANNGSTNAPNPPNCAPAGGAADHFWLAGAIATVLDDTPAVQVAFTGYPSGYVNRTTLTGQPNNPSMAVATRRLTAASENPGAFATDRTDIALAFTVAVEMEP